MSDMSGVTLFTQPGCGPCAAVKGQLTRRRIPFVTVDVSVDEGAAALLRANGCVGTPVLRYGGTFYRTPTQILEWMRGRS